MVISSAKAISAATDVLMIKIIVVLLLLSTAGPVYKNWIHVISCLSIKYIFHSLIGSVPSLKICALAFCVREKA